MVGKSNSAYVMVEGLLFNHYNISPRLPATFAACTETAPELID